MWRKIMKGFLTKCISVALLSLTFVTASAMATHHESEKLDMMETVLSNPSFTTLVTAIKAAGLVDTLKGEGPFTLFAPTNDAFVKLSASTLGDLLDIESQDKLTDILTYHILEGKLMAADVEKLNKAKTVQDNYIAIDTSDGLKINNATVIQTDIMTSNGVIHIIDTVMFPKM
jgi:uncharacterized surface protein with fasciclin (FAS1) repeats